MKALMKLAGAAKFFQRVERKKEVITDEEVRQQPLRGYFSLKRHPWPMKSV